VQQTGLVTRSRDAQRTRDFDAPVSAALRAHPDPDLVKQWMVPHRPRRRIP